MPKRIQRSRAKGWRMPAGAIYVGRPTMWGNPWEVGLVACGCRSTGECNHNSETAQEAVDIYRAWITTGAYRRQFLWKLRGHDLCCWCPLVDKDGNPVPCHADVLLELANRDG
jgi:hypothetical protein